MKKEEAESQQTLAAAGYTLTQAKPEDVTRAVGAVKPYWDEWAKTRGPDVVDALGQGPRRARPLTARVGHRR